LHVLLRREDWAVNSKRVYRIYVEEKLVVRKRKRRRRICAQARVLLAAPVKKNETWTMDFLQDALSSGRKVRTLSIEDAYTREMLAIKVDTSLPAHGKALKADAERALGHLRALVKGHDLAKATEAEEREARRVRIEHAKKEKLFQEKLAALRSDFTHK